MTEAKKNPPKKPTAKQVAARKQTKGRRNTEVVNPTPTPPTSSAYHVAIVISVAGQTLFRDIQANFGCDIDGSTINGVRGAIASQVGADPKAITILSWQEIATPTPNEGA